MSTALVEELDVIERCHSARVCLEAMEEGRWIPTAEVLAAVRDLVASAEAKAARL